MKQQILPFFLVVIILHLSSCSDDPAPSYYDQNVQQLTSYVYKEYTFGNDEVEEGLPIKLIKEIKVYKFNGENQGNLEIYGPLEDDKLFGFKNKTAFTWDLTGSSHQHLVVDYSRSLEFKDIAFTFESMTYTGDNTQKQLVKELATDVPLSDDVTYYVEDMVSYPYSHLYVDYIYLAPALLTIKTSNGIMKKHAPIYPLKGELRKIESNQDLYIYMVTDNKSSAYSYTFTPSKIPFQPTTGKYYFYIGKYTQKTKELEKITNKVEYKVK